MTRLLCTCGAPATHMCLQHGPCCDVRAERHAERRCLKVTLIARSARHQPKGVAMVEQKRPRRTATLAAVAALTSRTYELESMVKSLILLHEHPEQMDGGVTSGGRLIANAKKLLTPNASQRSA